MNLDTPTPAVNEKPANPPAFPQSRPQYDDLGGVVGSTTSGGMSLRDYFAAAAMAALIDGYDYEAREKSCERAQRTGFDDCPNEDSDSTFASQLSEEAYLIADAMLKARAAK